MASKKGFDEAWAKLLTLQSNTLARFEKNLAVREAGIQIMRAYLDRCQLVEPVKNLKVIHVAGTKGKGSTCAFLESMLRYHGLRTGLFTSPHLVNVRERIRINGMPVSEASFLKNFWWCWDRLETTSDQCPIPGMTPMPPFFRFMTLLGFSTFIEQQVDVAVVEVGLGGRLDATNVVEPPGCVVTGITLLDMDHTAILGNSIQSIAREKAGIMKQGVPIVTVPQPDGCLEVLLQEAESKGVFKKALYIARPPSDLRSSTDFLQEARGADGQGGGLLDSDHQWTNAALAVALCDIFMAQNSSQNITGAVGVPHSSAPEQAPSYKSVHPMDLLRPVDASPDTVATAGRKCKTLWLPPLPSSLPSTTASALSATVWPGRSHSITITPSGPGLQFTSSHTSTCNPTVGNKDFICDGPAKKRRRKPTVSLHIDGAHTKASMKACGQWANTIFQRTRESNTCRGLWVLLFNCGYEKPLEDLLDEIVSSGVQFDVACFCPNNSDPPSKKLLLDKLQRGSNPVQNSEGPCVSLELQAFQVKAMRAWENAAKANDSLEQCRSRVFENAGQAVDYILEDVVDQATDRGKDVHVLVTGSLYLVGSVYEKLADDFDVKVPGLSTN